MTQLIQEGNDYRPEPTEHSEIPDVTEELGKFSLLRFLTETEAGDGGGLHLGLLDVALFEIVEITFQDMYMTENEAGVGGDAAQWRRRHRNGLVSRWNVCSHERSVLERQQQDNVLSSNFWNRCLPAISVP